jgi:hypothetical protein
MRTKCRFRFMTTVTENLLEFLLRPASLFPTSRESCVREDRQPGRDAKVLSGNQPGMWEQDQTNLPNESLTGIFRRPL